VRAAQRLGCYAPEPCLPMTDARRKGGAAERPAGGVGVVGSHSGRPEVEDAAARRRGNRRSVAAVVACGNLKVVAEKRQVRRRGRVHICRGSVQSAQSECAQQVRGAAEAK